MGCAVTVSATYGAGGGVVGRALAARLGVPFLDRAVPGAVAERIGCSLEEALRRDDRAPSGLERMLASAARLPTVTLGSVDMSYLGAADAEGRIYYDRDFVDRTEQVLARIAEEGGVVLGRAGAVVLAGAPGVLHVRLDGPKARRLEQAAALPELARAQGLPEPPGDGGEALPDPDAGDREDPWHPPTMRDLEQNDRARSAYVRRYYRTDPADPSLYHLVLDSTAVRLGSCADIAERLARELAAGRTGV
ncbi:cytidylate kinase-like family protein [Nocardiopsis potens]|uniref:cytidylate kinase-like family protein n=1 Tax=Nocardiopsis potens TaxID=1246458 RepID=UPI000346A282|nr:cytidylate kinase-like family protein [Nocardiopsis potens]